MIGLLFLRVLTLLLLLSLHKTQTQGITILWVLLSKILENLLKILNERKDSFSLGLWNFPLIFTIGLLLIHIAKDKKKLIVVIPIVNECSINIVWVDKWKNKIIAISTFLSKRFIEFCCWKCYYISYSQTLFLISIKKWFS